MPLTNFATSFARNLVLSSYKDHLTKLLGPVQVQHVVWMIKNNKDFVEFLPKNLDMEGVSRYKGITKIVTINDTWNILREIRPDIASCIEVEANGKDWFSKQMKLLRVKLFGEVC